MCFIFIIFYSATQYLTQPDFKSNMLLYLSYSWNLKSSLKPNYDNKVGARLYILISFLKACRYINKETYQWQFILLGNYEVIWTMGWSCMYKTSALLYVNMLRWKQLKLFTGKQWMCVCAANEVIPYKRWKNTYNIYLCKMYCFSFPKNKNKNYVLRLYLLVKSIIALIIVSVSRLLRVS